MTKTSKELIVTGFLAVVLALLIINTLNKEGEQGAVVERSGKRVIVESIEKSAINQERERQSERTKMKWGRDPFFEKGGVKEEMPQETPTGEELSLKGILWSKKNPTALFNMQAVTKGESISDYIVVDIQKDRVILRKDGREYEFKLKR